MAAWRVLLALAALSGAFAQKTDAVCGADFDWMNNALKQSPCLVAAYLGQQCLSSEFKIPALPQGKVYTNEPATECACNPVYFSLIQACALCQSSQTTTYSQWTNGCPANATGQVFPRPVSTATAIPPYAAIPLSQDGNFDATAALRLVDPSRANAPAPGLPVYAIALIVVFSSLTLVAAIGLGFYCYRRRQQRHERVLVTDASSGRPRHYYAHLEPPPRPRGLAGVFKLAPKKVERYDRAMSFDLNTARTSGSLDKLSSLGKFSSGKYSHNSRGSGDRNDDAGNGGFWSNLGPSTFGPFSRVKEVTHTAPRSTFGLDQDDEEVNERSPVRPDMESYMLGSRDPQFHDEPFIPPREPYARNDPYNRSSPNLRNEDGFIRADADGSIFSPAQTPQPPHAGHFPHAPLPAPIPPPGQAPDRPRPPTVGLSDLEPSDGPLRPRPPTVGLEDMPQQTVRPPFQRTTAPPLPPLPANIPPSNNPQGNGTGPTGPASAANGHANANAHGHGQVLIIGRDVGNAQGSPPGNAPQRTGNNSPGNGDRHGNLQDSAGSGIGPNRDEALRDRANGNAMTSVTTGNPTSQAPSAITSGPYALAPSGAAPMSTTPAPVPTPTPAPSGPILAPLRPNRLDPVGIHIPAVGAKPPASTSYSPPSQQTRHSPPQLTPPSSQFQPAPPSQFSHTRNASQPAHTAYPPTLGHGGPYQAPQAAHSHAGLPDPNALLPQPPAVAPQFAEQSKLFPPAVRAAGYVGVPFEEDQQGER